MLIVSFGWARQVSSGMEAQWKLSTAVAGADLRGFAYAPERHALYGGQLQLPRCEWDFTADHQTTAGT